MHKSTLQKKENYKQNINKLINKVSNSVKPLSHHHNEVKLIHKSDIKMIRQSIHLYFFNLRQDFKFKVFKTKVQNYSAFLLFSQSSQSDNTRPFKRFNLLF